MKMKHALIGSGCIFALLMLIYVIARISYSNGEIRQRNLVSAQQETCEAFFDKMWKVLQQKAQVSAQYKNAFAEIYPGLMAGRYSGERAGALMSWIQESNPNFDTSLYQDLSKAIEAERTAFFYEQKKLISVNNEHKNMIQTFPGTWFLSGRELIQIVVVTSEQTQAAFSTGKEDNVNLFGK